MLKSYSIMSLYLSVRAVSDLNDPENSKYGY